MIIMMIIMIITMIVIMIIITISNKPAQMISSSSVLLSSLEWSDSKVYEP